MFIKDMLLLLSSLICVCSCFCLYFFLPSVFFPSRLPFSTPALSPTHSDIIAHTLLPWHTLQHSAYHALLSTQTHISFHNNNPAPCPRLPFSSLLPFHIYLSLILSYRFTLLDRQGSQRLFTWQWL